MNALSWLESRGATQMAQAREIAHAARRKGIAGALCVAEVGVFQLRRVINVNSCGGEEGRRHRHRQGPVNRGTEGLGQRA